MKRPHTLSLAGWLAIFVATATAADLTPSLVRDGGMETWLEVKPEQALFNRLKTLQVSRADNGSILMPSAYEQGAVTLVEREEKDAASGRFALRLKGDSFYFREGFPNAYAARRGDIYVSRFMAKGTGTAAIMLTVYGGGSAYTLDQKGKPQPDTWTLIEQRILIGGASPDRIYPRLAVTGDVLIDDVFLGRVLRKEDAVAAQAVPKEFDERIAFAAAATKPPAIDGRLDDECWKSATPFSGFRVTSEQGLLVPEQASARVAYDPEAVYLGIEVPLADADRVLADLESAARRGDPTADAYSARHSVEVFLQPPGQARYVQCVASLDGCRFDGTGVGKDNFAWNGQWTFGVHAAKQGWTLEMRIPAGDLTLPKIESAEGWRLNLVDNRDGPYGTWAAVGNNFHNPFGFGALVTRDFAVWRQDKLAAWDTLRRTIADAAARLRLDVTDRLDRAARFAESLPAPAADKQLDWQTVTRTYARMNFVDAVYRAMEAEISYADVLSTATDAKASPGIMGVTKGAVALAVPPGGLREEGHAVRETHGRYGMGFLFQVGPTTAAAAVNIRIDATGLGDFENGADVYLFDAPARIASGSPVPITRNETYRDSQTGIARIRVKYPSVGGFVPREALRTDSSPHPHAGSGFGICQVLDWPTVTAGPYAGVYDWKAKPEHCIELSQQSFDGTAFRVVRRELFRDEPLQAGDSGWIVHAPGMTTAVSDGDDLLQAVLATSGEGTHAVGIVRWSNLDGQWRPVSFRPVPNTGRYSEPSLVRDGTDLLFTARLVDYHKRTSEQRTDEEAYAIRVWRSADAGTTWSQTADIPAVRDAGPLSIGRAADGTPFIVGNPVRGDRSYSRESLMLWPLDASRSTALQPLEVRNLPAEFGSLAFADRERRWKADHPTAEVLRLADGRWHGVIAYRVMDQANNQGAQPLPQTGFYLEEVQSEGPARPAWTFAADTRAEPRP